jgi:hypothetical protein
MNDVPLRSDALVRTDSHGVRILYAASRSTAIPVHFAVMFFSLPILSTVQKVKSPHRVFDQASHRLRSKFVVAVIDEPPGSNR